MMEMVLPEPFLVPLPPCGEGLGVGVAQWPISSRVNFAVMSLKRRRSCGNNFGFSKAQTGTSAGKCQLAYLLPTLPVIVASWLWNLMAGNIASRKTLPLTRRAMLNFKDGVTVLSGSGMLMYLRTLKVLLT